jgi:hypothetical protein
MTEWIPYGSASSLGLDLAQGPGVALLLLVLANELAREAEPPIIFGLMKYGALVGVVVESMRILLFAAMFH